MCVDSHLSDPVAILGQWLEKHPCPDVAVTISNHNYPIHGVGSGYVSFTDTVNLMMVAQWSRLLLF
jgi:hypothetical protein